MYMKRAEVLRKIPIHRKGTTYVVTARNHKKFGVPILIVLRDMLNLTKNRTEAKKVLNENEVSVNGRVIKDDRFCVLLFDNITFKSMKKNYRLLINKRKKFELAEVNNKDAGYKICKIINKKIVKRERVQINLDDGRNLLTTVGQSKKIKTGDSILLNLKDNSIEKHIPLKENSKVFIFAGSHTGNFAKIEKISDKKAAIKIENKIYEIQTKDMIVMENG